MLPHSCVYEEYLGNTGEGDKWSSTTTLRFVKIEEKEQFRIDNNGKEIVGNARLFYDIINSQGLNEKPVFDSKITFNDKVYKIVDVDTLYSNSSKPHHYEIILR